MTHKKLVFYISILGILTFVQSCEKEEFNELNLILTETAQPGPVITNADIQQLPLPVQTHLLHCKVVGQPRHYNVKMKGSGNFKQSATDSWHHLDNSFYLMFKPACRFWFGEIESAAGTMTGMDYYRDGAGRLSIRYFPNTSFQEADDNKVVISELITLLSEHVYNPTAFMNSNITWSQATDTSVLATITDAGISCSGIFYINSSGFIYRFVSTERYKGSGNEATIETWEVILENYQQHEGIYVPTEFKATWLLKTGPLEYINGSVNEIDFDVTEM